MNTAGRTATITLNGAEMTVPPDVDFIGQGDMPDLYLAPFDLLRVAEEEELLADSDSYSFSNPRRLGGGDNQGQGFAKQDIAALCGDIRDEGLFVPPICRWVLKDGVLTIQILDGERRYRCITMLVEKNELCYSKAEKRFIPAKELYRRVPCQILTGNDKEALRVAFMVSDRSVGWGEAATAKLIKKLRKCNCTDDEIIALTKKSDQWLREMDRICGLDDLTFSYLQDCKINRALALQLAKIENLAARHKWLKATYQDAVEHHAEEQAHADAALERAEMREEFAESELAEAESTASTEVIAEASAKLEEAKEKTETKRRARAAASRPQARTKNLRRVSAEDGEGDGVQVALRPGAIRKQLEVMEILMANGGKDEDGHEIFPPQYLQGIVACYKAILSGEDDIVKVLKRQRNVLRLIEEREKSSAVRQTDDDDDEEK